MANIGIVDSPPTYCDKSKNECSKCLDMFRQIYGLIRLDQRRDQVFEDDRLSQIAPAGEDTWGYTEASCGRIILYNKSMQKQIETYLQGSISFTNTIVKNLREFLFNFDNADIEHIRTKIKNNAIHVINNRQQHSPDENGVVGYFGKYNFVAGDANPRRRVIIPSRRHTATGLMLILQLDGEFESDAFNAFDWLVSRAVKVVHQKEMFHSSVDDSCVLAAVTQFQYKYTDIYRTNKNRDEIDLLIARIKDNLENQALQNKELYGGGQYDPWRIMNSLWIMDNFPQMKSELKRMLLSNIIAKERYGGIPFWVGKWPRGSKEMDRLIPHQLSYHPDFGATVALANILCREQTVQGVGDEYCEKYSKRYYSWLIRNYNKTLRLLGTNSRQWSFLLSLPLCHKVKNHFETMLPTFEEEIEGIRDKLGQNKRNYRKFPLNNTSKKIFRLRMLNQRLHEHEKIRNVFPMFGYMSMYAISFTALIFGLLALSINIWVINPPPIILQVMTAIIVGIFVNWIYDKIR